MALLILNSQPRHAPSLCMWAVKVLAIFRGCAGSSELSLLAYAIGTIISGTGLFHDIKYVNILKIHQDAESCYNQFISWYIYVRL